MRNAAAWSTTSGAEQMTSLSEVLIRLRAAVAELIKLNEESAGAIDLSSAIEVLERAVRELEEAR